MSNSTFKIKRLTTSLTWESWSERLNGLLQRDEVDFYEIKNHLHLPKADPFFFDGNPEARHQYFWLLFELHQHIRRLIFRDHERMAANVHREIGDTKFKDHELCKWQELYSLVHGKFVEQLEWALYVPPSYAKAGGFWQDDKKGLRLTPEVAEKLLRWYVDGRKRPQAVPRDLRLSDDATKKKENKKILRFMVFMVEMALVNDRPYFDHMWEFSDEDQRIHDDLHSLAHTNIIPIVRWLVETGRSEELTGLWCVNRDVLQALEIVLNERYGRFGSLEQAFARQGGVINAGSHDLVVYFTLQKHLEGQGVMMD